MKKKLALLLCLVLLVTALALPVSADNSAAWDGSVDTSWYSTEAKTFEISTPAQLAGLSAITNGKADGIKKDNFFGKTIKLMADLDLGGVKAADGTWSGQMWKPISRNYGDGFKGTFLGSGHTISNLYIDGGKDDSLNNNLGLFGYILEDGLVKAVKIGSGQITSTEQLQPKIGGIAGVNDGVIIACYNGADLYARQFAGGIVGWHRKGAVSQCVNAGKVTRTASDVDMVGGIAGQSDRAVNY